MAESRKSYIIRLQPRDRKVKAIIQWLESKDKTEQRDLILRAVRLLYNCYVGEFQGLSKSELLERFHLNKGQVDDHFYTVFLNVFGEEKAGILNHYFPEKVEPTFGHNSPPKPSINSKPSMNFEEQQDNEDEDDLYGGEIDEDLGDEVSF